MVLVVARVVRVARFQVTPGPAKTTCWMGLAVFDAVLSTKKLSMVTLSEVPAMDSSSAVPTRRALMSVGRMPAANVSVSRRLALVSTSALIVSWPPPRVKT